MSHYSSDGAKRRWSSLIAFYKLLRYLSYLPFSILQVSLRDPLRQGADDNELKEIIGAAVGASKLSIISKYMQYASVFMSLLPNEFA